MMFTEQLAAAIVRGEKTQTRRQLSENPRSPWHTRSRSYPIGKRFTVNPGRGVARVAECEVTGRSLQALGLVTWQQAKAEGFRSVLAFRDAWAKINRSFDPSQLVRVVEFKLVGSDCMGCDGCGWCEGSPAWTCTDCFGTGIEVSRAAAAMIAKLDREAE